jgi:hypothetical protein
MNPCRADGQAVGAETLDALEVDGRTTYEDCYMNGTDLWVYFDDDDDSYEENAVYWGTA